MTDAAGRTNVCYRQIGLPVTSKIKERSRNLLNMEMSFRNLKFITLITIAGCDTASPVRDIAPFPDRPTEMYSFQYTTVRVSGVVWLFERDGRPVIYGGPVGLIYEDSVQPAVLISGMGIDLLTASDVTDTDREQIKALARAAATFCTGASYTVREDGGASIFTDQGDVYLIDFCSPETR